VAKKIKYWNWKQPLVSIYIYIADCPHDDPDYMEDVMRNMIDDGSQYFTDYNELVQDNPAEQ